MQASAYWHWREQASDPTPPSHSPSVEPEDTPGLKWCPDCYHALHRFRVGLDVGFGLDHCGHCGGVWLDKNEWSALKSRGLEQDLYHVFTDAWQDRIRRTQRIAITEAQFRRALGTESFELATDFKDWLDRQPNRGQILAYLQWEVGRD